MPGRAPGTPRGVCHSAWSVHLSGQTSTLGHPSYRGKVSHLCAPVWGAQVCLEMRTLPAGLAAACVITSVRGRPFPGPPPPPPLWLGLLRPAGTGWHERVVMARWDVRLHLVGQAGRVVGPRAGTEARGKRQGRVKVRAAQQFLGARVRVAVLGSCRPRGKSCAGSRWSLLSGGPVPKRASRSRPTVHEETASRLTFGHTRGGPPL